MREILLELNLVVGSASLVALVSLILKVEDIILKAQQIRLNHLKIEQQKRTTDPDRRLR